CCSRSPRTATSAAPATSCASPAPSSLRSSEPTASSLIPRRSSALDGPASLRYIAGPPRRKPVAEVYDTSEFRNGLKILYDRDPFEIVEFQHVKPGKGSAFVRTRIRNLLTGRILEPTLKSGDKVGRPDIEEKEMQYLYKEGDHYVFMDVKTYDQVHVGGDS